MTDGTEPEAAAGSQPLVPTWVRGNTNLFAMLVAGVVVGVGVFLISWLSPVLAPLVLGLFLAALAAPLFTWLEARGRSAALALTLTVGIVLVVGAALVLLALSRGGGRAGPAGAVRGGVPRGRPRDVLGRARGALSERVRRHGREPRGLGPRPH